MNERLYTKLYFQELLRRKAHAIYVCEKIGALFGLHYNEVAQMFRQARLVHRRKLDVTTSHQLSRMVTQLYGAVDRLIRAGVVEGKTRANAFHIGIERHFGMNTQEAVQGFEKIPHDYSKRIWKQSKYHKKQLQKTIVEALQAGKDHKQLSKELNGYVYEKAQGKGIYKDPKKNAERLARNEINQAYAQTDYDRWQKQWFVVGIEIKLSNAHPMHDMCDNLKGVYPKDFKFSGWHVNCLCVAVPKLATEAERKAYEDFRLGLTDKKPPIVYVQNQPVAFNRWVRENTDRVNSWKNKPYWWRENKKYVSAEKQ